MRDIKFGEHKRPDVTAMAFAGWSPHSRVISSPCLEFVVFKYNKKPIYTYESKYG